MLNSDYSFKVNFVSTHYLSTFMFITEIGSIELKMGSAGWVGVLES